MPSIAMLGSHLSHLQSLKNLNDYDCHGCIRCHCHSTLYRKCSYNIVPLVVHDRMMKPNLLIMPACFLLVPSLVLLSHCDFSQLHRVCLSFPAASSFQSPFVISFYYAPVPCPHPVAVCQHGDGQDQGCGKEMREHCVGHVSNC